MDTSNPYEAPQNTPAPVAPSPTPEPTNCSGRWPLGIYFFPLWLLFVAYMLKQYLMWSAQQDGLFSAWHSGWEELDRLMRLVYIKDCATLVLLLSAAIGLWLQQRWAWWLASFYVAQEIITQVFVVAHFAVRHQVWPEWSLVQNSAGRLSFHLLLLAYLLKTNVRTHFNTSHISKIGVCISLFIATVVAQASWWIVLSLPSS